MDTKSLKLLKLATPAALSLALLMTAACSSLPKGQTEQRIVTKGSEPGMYAVETTKITATVTSVDAANRKVTVVTPDGKQRVIKAGPEVANFNQIRIGDQVKVTVASELVVSMAKDVLTLPDGKRAVVALAAEGDKPGVLMAETTQITAKVVGLDRKSRKAMIQLPDGTTKTFTVRQDVDLSQRKIGEEIVIRYTETHAVLVEKP